MTTIETFDRTGADGAESTGGAGHRPLRREATAVFGALVALAAAVVVAASVTTVAQSRFSGTTTNEGSLFAAGAIDVQVGGREASVTALSIDVENLAPGTVVDRCIVTRYRGDVDDVTVRLSGRLDGGTGLERFLATRVETGTGDMADCGDFTSGAEAFTGTLDRLWLEHGTFDTGVMLLDGAADGDVVTVRIELSVLSDDRAQGRTTEFWLDVEGRP